MARRSRAKVIFRLVSPRSFLLITHTLACQSELASVHGGGAFASLAPNHALKSSRRRTCAWSSGDRNSNGSGSASKIFGPITRCQALPHISNESSMKKTRNEGE